MEISGLTLTSRKRGASLMICCLILGLVAVPFSRRVASSDWLQLGKGIERAMANEDPRGFMTAIAILDPIATGERAKKRDTFDAQYQLGHAHGETGNMALARAWCMSSFFCKMADPTCSAITSAPAIGARIACGRLRMWAQVKFWNEIAKNLPIPTGLCNGERRNRVESLVWHCQYLRKLRDSCGGCGASFEGKERKFCRGCRTYCYCGRACQKNHWNRKENSHREDCKAAMELKQKFVRMGDAAMKRMTSRY